MGFCLRQKPVPVTHQPGLVRGVLVHNEMEVETALDSGLDLVEELA